jgi:transposase
MFSVERRPCMARTSKRPRTVLTEEQKSDLERIARSRTAQAREVERANILLRHAAGASISSIRGALHVSKPTIYKCIDKAAAAGPERGLKDLPHAPREPVITEDAKAWVVNLACTKPKDHGYAAELWTQSQLALHTRRHAPEAGHSCLKQASKATIHRILKAQPLQPHKIKYYLERRDPEFERKMQDVLVVYGEVNFQNDAGKACPVGPPTVTVSVDEKPGVQAIKNTAKDLPPVAGEHPSNGRDYEYRRLGTVSILAALDLHTGHVTAQVHDRHRSREFISLLKELDAYYPTDCVIRVVLDNHSAHISRETLAFLATRPNRFVYVHTPKHGSWLNLVETLFSKMARTFLRHIRVESKTELKERIMRGVAEINAAPVVHRWQNFEAAA